MQPAATGTGEMMKSTAIRPARTHLIAAALAVLLAACTTDLPTSELAAQQPEPQQIADDAENVQTSADVNQPESTPSAAPTPAPDTPSVPSATPSPTPAPAPTDPPRDEPASTSIAEATWPDESNTGVGDGIAFKPSGTIKVTQDGATIEGYEVTGSIIIDADNVTVRNVIIRAGDHYPIDVERGRVGALIEDVEIDGRGRTRVAICCSNYTVRRANIHNVIDGPRVGDNTTVEDSYIHDLVARTGTHNDGIQSTGGTNIVIRRNHIDNKNSQTSAILIAPNAKSVSEVTVEDNLLRGGGYTLYFFDRSGVVRGNRFDDSHRYGAVHGDTYAGTWTDNRYLSGSSIACPSC